MDIIGIDIKSGLWTVTHVKRTLFGVKLIKCIELSAADNSERLDALEQYLFSNGISKGQIAISLPRGSYVSRVLEVPAPGIDAIEGILKFELERHLPYPVEEACFSFEVLKREENRFSIYFAAARNEYVDNLLSEFSARGIVPNLICVEQASFLNALLFKKKEFASLNTAFVEAGPEGFELYLLLGTVPVYLKSVFTGGAISADWLDKLYLELKAAVAGCASFASSGIKIDRCVVISDQEVDKDFLAELSKRTNIEVEAGDYLNGMGSASGGLPAFGAAVSACGKGLYNIDFSPSKPDNRLRNTVALAVVAVVCLVVVSVSYIGRDILAVSRFESAVTEVKVKGEQMRALTESAIEMEERVEILEQYRGMRSYGVMDVFKELSETIPSNTWLTGFEYKGNSVLLEGFSRNASAMLFVIEKSSMFKDVELTGQVVKRRGLEHFTLKLHTRELSKITTASAEER